jgi:SAM-dependent methyltransferase
VAALRLLAGLEQAARPALPQEQAVLVRWSGWGAVPAVFDEADDRYAVARDELRALVDDDEWAAARRTTLNAHYTDPAVVNAMWDGLAQMGFTSGRVLEPGCGSGHFIGFAEGRGAEMIGVERDPTSARIAQALYPDADIHNVKFQRFDLAEPVDAVIGNVPFAEPHAFDPTCARSRRRCTGPGWSRAEPSRAEPRYGHPPRRPPRSRGRSVRAEIERASRSCSIRAAGRRYGLPPEWHSWPERTRMGRTRP